MANDKLKLVYEFDIPPGVARNGLRRYIKLNKPGETGDADQMESWLGCRRQRRGRCWGPGTGGLRIFGCGRGNNPFGNIRSHFPAGRDLAHRPFIEPPPSVKKTGSTSVSPRLLSNNSPFHISEANPYDDFKSNFLVSSQGLLSKISISRAQNLGRLHISSNTFGQDLAVRISQINCNSLKPTTQMPTQAVR